MQTINMIMRFLRIKYALFFSTVLMLSLVSCHNEPVTLNPLASLNIEIQKKSISDGIASKNMVSDFDAVVSIAYEDDTVAYNCRFVASDSISELYMYDYTRSDVVYATMGKPFRILVDATIGSILFHGESEVYILEGELTTVSIELASSFSYIDLGLPSGLLWAKCNLGATSPEEYGGFYAWGETGEKVAYSWDTYIYFKDSAIVKYNSSDGSDVLEPIDDAASAILGASWRIPTKAEFDELLNNCTATFTTSNGVSGYQFTGPNGNSIFMPMAGGRDGDGLLSGGESGFYWLSSLYSDDTDYAWGFLIDSESVYATSYYRMYGQTIRPVYGSR